MALIPSVQSWSGWFISPVLRIIVSQSTPG